MKEFIFKIKKSKGAEAVKKVLDSKYFPFVTAAVMIFCYYLGLDLLAIYYAALVAVAMFFLLDDLTPLLPHFLFLNVMISYRNSPSTAAGSSDYYTRIGNLVQVGILIGLCVAAIIIKIVLLFKNKAYKPTAVFYGLCALCIAFFFNGVGAAEYNPMGLLFALFMTFFFLAVYAVVAGGVRLTEENFIKIGCGFLAFSILLVIELAVKYATDFDNIIVDGYINKGAVVFGWGVWNHIGTFFAMCIPVIFMLAAKSKYGYLYIVYATLLLACAFLTGSRQAVLGGCFAYGVAAMGVIIKSRKLLINRILIGCILIAVIIFVAMKWQSLLVFFVKFKENLFNGDGEFSGNGRIRLYRLAVEYFTANPIFGGGFFSEFELFGLVGLTDSIIPTFAHNTIMEIMGTCGIVGLVAYCAHRVTTVVGFFKKPSFNKYYIAMSLVTLLLICLVDNYIFYMLPTMIYSGMLPFATGTEEKESP